MTNTVYRARLENKLEWENKSEREFVQESASEDGSMDDERGKKSEAEKKSEQEKKSELELVHELACEDGSLYDLHGYTEELTTRGTCKKCKISIEKDQYFLKS